MVRLGVNIDHVATLRQARKGMTPDPAHAAAVAEASGADSIVAHLREDRRHIQDADIALLRRCVRTRFNLEMSVAPEIVEIACEVGPQQATLVPERRQELTTEGGLDAAGGKAAIRRACRRLSDAGIEVSLFIAPHQRQIAAAAKLGVPMIELHTGEYAQARTAAARRAELSRLRDAARYAASLGLEVAAGHGLDYENVAAVRRIPQIVEYNIGYSIICRALFCGLGRAVAEMKELME
jgi:pyridoxine 5-phosphate synthase